MNCMRLRKIRYKVSAASAVYVVLPPDQTKPADRNFLRHERQRRESPNLDRRVRLRPGGHREKGTSSQTEPLRNSTDFERHPV